MKQTWDKNSIDNHFINLNKDELLNTILGLKSEGKNVINVLNQKILAKKLNGKFVGDIIDDYDIEVNDLKLELKCNVNQAMDLGRTVGFASFLQKEDYDYLIHYTPSAFNSYLKEDKFVVIPKSDLSELENYCNNNGGIRWTYKLFNPNHTINNRGGHKKKLEFIRKRIMNTQELYNLIWK